jgi:hypothetical protein
MFNIGLSVGILSFIDMKMAVLGCCVAFLQNKDLTDNGCIFKRVNMNKNDPNNNEIIPPKLVFTISPSLLKLRFMR